MVKVKVPASTSNLGSGFDVFGLALSLFLELSLEESSKREFLVEGEGKDFLPTDDRNLVFKALDFFCMKTGKKPRTFLVKARNNIPISRGLGSSAAAIVGSLAAANRIYQAGLGLKEIFQMAVELEGHPDNVSASVFGGFTLSLLTESGFEAFSYQLPPELKVFLLVPSSFLSTRKARQVLPEKVKLNDVVYNISRSSLLVLSLIRGDWERVKEGMRDRIHQPYRQSLIPKLSFLLEELNAIPLVLGASLSGAGPSLVGLYRYSDEKSLKEGLEYFLVQKKVDYQLKLLKIENKGFRISEE